MSGAALSREQKEFLRRIEGKPMAEHRIYWLTDDDSAPRWACDCGEDRDHCPLGLLHIAEHAFRDLRRSSVMFSADYPRSAEDAYEAVSEFLFPDPPEAASPTVT
jgi:hypothetical protein